jgi:hypothetical protein
VHQDHRVGLPLAVGLTGVQHVEHLAGQRVPLRVRAAVLTDQQNVDGAVQWLRVQLLSAKTSVVVRPRWPR